MNASSWTTNQLRVFLIAWCFSALIGYRVLTRTEISTKTRFKCDNFLENSWYIVLCLDFKTKDLLKLIHAKISFIRLLCISVYPMFNPRSGRGSMHPTLSFFFCDARQTMSQIVLKFCMAYGASFAQLLEKNFDRIMSGYGAMTSQKVQGQAIFARNSGIWHIRRRYRGFFWLF